jgi:hypothetical protein
MTFSNPAKRNAMSLEMWGAMREILEDFQADPEIRVVVMQGDGDRAFAATPTRPQLTPPCPTAPAPRSPRWTNHSSH